MAAHKLSDAQTLEYIVKATISKNQDFIRLLEISEATKPEHYSVSRYQTERINQYLDLYNESVEKEEYMLAPNVPNKLFSRQTALWKTYKTIAEDNEIYTRNWTFNPGQLSLGENTEH